MKPKKADYSLLFMSEEVMGKDQMGSLKGGQTSCTTIGIGVTDLLGDGNVCTTLYIGVN
jgi:hypothetical protein